VESEVSAIYSDEFMKATRRFCFCGSVFVLLIP
jgi:hypothetical protein